MKLLLILFTLLLLSLSAFSQNKVYRQLKTPYPGLKPEQLSFDEANELTSRASFNYKGKDYIAYFSSDSIVSSIKKIITEKELPGYIQSEIKCLFRTYNPLQASITQQMEKGVLKPEKDYTLIVGTTGATQASALVYYNGVRPKGLEVAELKNGDYMVYGMMGIELRSCPSQNWYKGSAEAFAADMQQHITFQNDSCINKFKGSTYTLKIEVAEEGYISEWELQGLTPYALDIKVEEYMRTIQFPKQEYSGDQDKYCIFRYRVQLTISSTGNMVVKPDKR